jgi:hypothetical protein
MNYHMVFSASTYLSKVRLTHARSHHPAKPLHIKCYEIRCT